MKKLFSKIAMLSVGLALAAGAVFSIARSNGNFEVRATDKIDTITAADTPNGWNSDTRKPGYTATVVTKNATYSMQNAITAASDGNLQFRSNNNNSGLVTTVSAGIASSISVVWASNTINGRTINVYGKTTAYSSPSDLYNDDTDGNLVGTIVKGSSTSLDFSDEYEYIGFRSNASALYLESVTIIWAEKDTSAPAVHITTEGCEFEIGDKGTFTATTENTDKNVVWSSSDSDVLEVNAITGAYEAKAIGAVDVYATLEGTSTSSRVPFTVTGTVDVNEAVTRTSALGSGVSTLYKVTVTGTISEVSTNDNKFVWLKSSTENKAFEIYLGYGSKPSGWDDFAIVDNDVSAKGYLCNYAGTTYEMTSPTNLVVTKTVNEKISDFITTYMHMDSDVEGQCNEYYADAKTAFNALSQSARVLFLSEAAYKDASDRLIAWANAKGDSLDESNLLAVYSVLFTPEGNNTITIVLIAVGVIVAFSVTLVFLSRKKRIIDK